MKPDTVVSLRGVTDWVHRVCQSSANTSPILEPGSRCLLFIHIFGSRKSGHVLLEGFAKKEFLRHALPDAFRKLLENPWGRKVRVWFVYKECSQGGLKGKRVFLCFRRDGDTFFISKFVHGDPDFPTIPKVLRAKAKSLVCSYA